MVSNLGKLVALGIESVDITTVPRHHHTIAIEALQCGWHVMVEKPMGLTVRACNLMRQAVEQSDCILSVAENYRRDPINRLAKALLQMEVIGTPRLLLHNSIGSGDRMVITVWWHQKNSSGILVDVGVHHADMMEYLLGEGHKSLNVNRERSSLNPEVDRYEQGGLFKLASDETLKLHIFMDKSVIEVFADDQVCLTSRIYPSRTNSLGIGLFARGGSVKLKAMDIWEMRSIWE